MICNPLTYCFVSLFLSIFWTDTQLTTNRRKSIDFNGASPLCSENLFYSNHSIAPCVYTSTRRCSIRHCRLQA